ncbi:MAG TPA: twin-arginine translocase TatA/TatE family subunit [Flavisolibacter sp.]|jgi:sec-independent protein translocase protein TatA
MGNFGWTEILLIAFVVLLLFGGKKIPELMRGLGRGVREFNDAKSNVRKEIEDSVVDKEPDTRKASSTTTPS